MAAKGYPVTDRMRDWLEAKELVAAGASDDDIRAAIRKAMKAGTLQACGFASWLEDTEPAAQVKRWREEGRGEDDPELVAARRTALGLGIDASYMEPEGDRMGDKAKGGSTADRVRVKDPSERYSAKRYEGRHVKTGQPVVYGGAPVMTPSELDKAKIGVLLKQMARKAGFFTSGPALTEHERSLLAEMVEKEAWFEPADDRQLGATPAKVDNVKALLDDTVSGGVFVAPMVFDAATIQYPLLNGELFPFVDLKEMAGGRRIQTAAIGNPTVSWGVPPGTAVQEFNTSSLITPISGTVYDGQCAVEISNNLQFDSPVDVGAELIERIGQRMLSELDRVVAGGNGTSEPQGFLNASGLTTIQTDASSNGPPTVGDYEGLIFAVPKQYRRADFNPCFVANDVSYRRARSISVGPGDERRVFGMDHQEYKLLEYPYRVVNLDPSAGGIANGTAAFACLRRYRLWRSPAFSQQFTREGRALALANTALLVMRYRFAGQVVDANGFAVWTDGQS